MRGIKKAHLPEKTCPACSRPFAWRKKWARNWDSVLYCSERCRRNRAGSATSAVALMTSAPGSAQGPASRRDIPGKRP